MAGALQRTQAQASGSLATRPNSQNKAPIYPPSNAAIYLQRRFPFALQLSPAHVKLKGGCACPVTYIQTDIHTKWHFFFNCWLLCFCNDVERHFPCLLTLSASLVGGCVESSLTKKQDKIRASSVFGVFLIIVQPSFAALPLVGGRCSAPARITGSFPPFARRTRTREMLPCAFRSSEFFFAYRCCLPLLPIVCSLSYAV